MKRQIHILMGTLLMTIILASCGTGRMMPNSKVIDHESHCGFGDQADAETNKEEVKSNSDVEVTERAAPAADRGNKLDKETAPTVTDQNLASANDSEESEETTETKIKRSDVKVGAKKKSKFKAIVKAVKKYKKNKRESGAMLVLLIILAIILPPLAVGIYEGITGRFWLVLVLWILGWGVGWWLLGGLGGLCSLVAVVLALLIVLGVW